MIGSSFERHFGGKGANQAVMACRLGGRAAMAGMLGSDAFAADYRAQMQAEGCDISAIGTAPGEASSSGVACITVDGAGRNTIVVVPGANAALAVADVDSRRDLFGGAAVLLCQNEVNIDVTIRALDLAAAAGCLTVFNPAPASAACAAAARHCHVLCPNEVELASLTGLPAESDDQVQTAAFKLLEESPNLLAVVVTLGGRGVCVVQRGEGAHGVTFTAAPKVDVVDTVGAGDCFIGKEHCIYYYGHVLSIYLRYTPILTIARLLGRVPGSGRGSGLCGVAGRAVRLAVRHEEGRADVLPAARGAARGVPTMTHACMDICVFIAVTDNMYLRSLSLNLNKNCKKILYHWHMNMLHNINTQRCMICLICCILLRIKRVLPSSLLFWRWLRSLGTRR